MQHFVYDDHLNIFRLPVGWQYLVANQLSGPLDPGFFAKYDGIVQDCLGTGAYCILDIHNYARWNGGIIGQGGPSNDDFVSVWYQLAQHYAAQPNVIFGLMNEPHDLDINTWAATLQAVVYGIRSAGATSQLILLSGVNYDAVGGFDSSSGPALSTIQDTDGTTSKLIFEMHEYLDVDSSGGHAECVTAQTDNLGYQAAYLRSSGRQALLTETGGGNTDSCVQYMCQQLQYLNDNSDVYLGWVGWAAGMETFSVTQKTLYHFAEAGVPSWSNIHPLGSFDPSYVLSEVPNGSTDTYLVSSCISGKFQ